VLYRVGGNLARRGDNLLAGGDSGCCCGIDCGCGCEEFECCNPVVRYQLGAPPTCAVADPGTGEAYVEARWVWNGCNFSWEVRTQFTQLGSNSLFGNFTYPADSGCDAPVGVWAAGTDGNDKEFQEWVDAPSRQCQNSAATVTIAKTAEGYSFTVAGIVVDVDWDGTNPLFGPCDDACDLLNGTWVVEC